MSETEQQPDYPDRVDAYLTRHNLRRLPWGCLVAHGGLTRTKTGGEVNERAALGEVAIALCAGLGVTEEQLAAMVESLPWTAAPDDYVRRLQELRTAPAAAAAP